MSVAHPGEVSLRTERMAIDKRWGRLAPVLLLVSFEGGMRLWNFCGFSQGWLIRRLFEVRMLFSLVSPRERIAFPQLSMHGSIILSL